MSDYESIRKMLAQTLEMKGILPKLYAILPREEYYRLSQLLEEAETILKRHQ